MSIIPLLLVCSGFPTGSRSVRYRSRRKSSRSCPSFARSCNCMRGRSPSFASLPLKSCFNMSPHHFYSLLSASSIGCHDTSVTTTHFDSLKYTSPCDLKISPSPTKAVCSTPSLAWTPSSEPQNPNRSTATANPTSGLYLSGAHRAHVDRCNRSPS